MVHISICDDDRVFAERFQKTLEREFGRHGVSCEYSVCCDGSRFLQSDSLQNADLIFLDIEMPEFSGLEIANELKDIGKNQRIVFVTAYDNLVFSALQLFPFYFLRKNCIDTEIESVVRQFLLSCAEEEQVFRYTIKGTEYTCRAVDIMFLTYWEHRIIMVCKDGKKIEFRATIKDCERQLDSWYFFRANSGQIVNLRYCTVFEQGQFVMGNSDIVVVARNRRKRARELFMQYRRSRR